MSMTLEGSSGLNAVLAVATAGAALTGLSGAATTYSSSLFGFAINGQAYAKAAVAGGTTPTTDGNSGAAMTLTAGQSRVFAWAVNSAGTVTVFAGAVQSTSGGALQYPSVPSSYAVFAVHKIDAGSTTVGTWTFGSSNWNATGITVGTVLNMAGGLPNTVLTAA